MNEADRRRFGRREGAVACLIALDVGRQRAQETLGVGGAEDQAGDELAGRMIGEKKIACAQK